MRRTERHREGKEKKADRATHSKTPQAQGHRAAWQPSGGGSRLQEDTGHRAARRHGAQGSRAGQRAWQQGQLKEVKDATPCDIG